MVSHSFAKAASRKGHVGSSPTPTANNDSLWEDGMGRPTKADYDYARSQLSERLRWKDATLKADVVDEVAHIIANTREYAETRQHPLFQQFKKHYNPYGDDTDPEKDDELRAIDLLNDFATSLHLPILGEGQVEHNNCLSQLRHFASDTRYSEKWRKQAEAKEKVRDDVRREVIEEISEKLADILPIAAPHDSSDSYTCADHDVQWNSDNEDAACDGNGSGPNG